MAQFSYEDFLKAVKEESVKMEMQSFDKAEAEERVNDAWSDMYESFGNKMFRDQFDALKEAGQEYQNGTMSGDIYKARISQNISAAAMNIWMLA